MAITTKTINSEAFSGQESTQTIQSNSSIRQPIILNGLVQITKPKENLKFAQTDMSNPIPSAPTTLVAVDAGLGDAVNLNWISPATRFNVYQKLAGPTYIRLNQVTLGNVHSYIAGGLPTGIVATFVVRAVNGLGQESSNSNEATATPTYTRASNRFSFPNYEVKVNSVTLSDAILGEVKIGYGSSLSTATFTLPRDPRTSDNPVSGDSVDVSINGRLIFRGTIQNISESIDTGGLSISYTCYSTIIDLMHTTLKETELDQGITKFNVFRITPDQKAELVNFKNANEILNTLNVINGPTDYPGEIDLTDLTPLSSAELVVSKVGNYKIYHDMPTGINSVYRFGSGGYITREFTVGVNILNYNIQVSDLDVVSQIQVVGAPTRIIRKYIPADMTIQRDPDGRYLYAFTLIGKNIRDIQVFGWMNDKPDCTFDDTIQVNPTDISGFSSGFGLTFPSFEEFHLDSVFNQNQAFPGASNTMKNNLTLYPLLKSIVNHSTLRQSVGATVAYNLFDQVTVYISEVPKIWKAITKSGYVSNTKVGLPGNGSFSATILLDYSFSIGPLEVFYTIDGDIPVATAGSGTPLKTITDSQYEILQDEVLNFNNSTDILNKMQIRAVGELARLSKPRMNGTLTIIGDETIDLRTTVRVKGELLEVMGVTHSFTNGFTTTIELTNEPFFTTIVPLPHLTIINNTRDRELLLRGYTETFDTKNISEAIKSLQSQKEKTDKQVPHGGTYSIIQKGQA